MSGYWMSSFPWRAKRQAFLANVAGRLWSGLEALALSDHECKALDQTLAKKLRAMMMGQAYERLGEDEHICLSTRQLLME